MKKQLISSVACLLLLLIMLLGSTLAWFSDSSGSVNTMVSGKISIEQVITDADGKPFEDDKFIMIPTQTITKTVIVTNTGNQDCYVRTLFAFEDSTATEVVEQLVLTGKDGIIVIPGVTKADPNTDPDPNDKIQFTVTEDGVTTLYTVGYCVNTAALEKNGTFVPLISVGLAAAASSDWTGAVGDQYELLVLSQATQTEGLDAVAATALDNVFGVIDATNSGKWFGDLLTAKP